MRGFVFAFAFVLNAWCVATLTIFFCAVVVCDEKSCARPLSRGEYIFPGRQAACWLKEIP
jgi:hypothetical protein